MLDTALRRRFGFIELLPNISLLNVNIEGLPLGPWLDALNQRIIAEVGRDLRNLQVGHAFFMEGEKPITDKGKFIRILLEDIIPLLEEYCYEDYQILGKILSPSLVDDKRQVVRENLLDINQWENLIRALLELSSDLSTSSQVTSTEEPPIVDESELSNDDNQ